jgi:hypothetical protein
VLKEARPPPSQSLAPGRPSLSVLQESSEHDLGGVGSDGGREIWGASEAGREGDSAGFAREGDGAGFATAIVLGS